MQIAIDVGSYGREGDAGIYLKSNIGQLIQENRFYIPDPKPLSRTDIVVPHVIVGDKAFALHENLMKPYPRQQSLHDQPKAIYNYRPSLELVDRLNMRLEYYVDISEFSFNL